MKRDGSNPQSTDRLTRARHYCGHCGRPHNPNWRCDSQGWKRLSRGDLIHERVGFLDGEHGPRRMNARNRLRTIRGALCEALENFIAEARYGRGHGGGRTTEGRDD
jgi:hypothetical protein